MATVELSVFGIGSTLDITVGTLALTGVVGFTVVFEMGAHRLEHRLAGTPYMGMLAKIYKELMIMGVISLGVLLTFELGDVGDTVGFLAFEFAHIVIFFTALIFVMQACLMMVFSAKLKNRYERSTNISVDHLLSIYSLHRKSKVFHARWLPFSDLREVMEFKIVYAFFRTTFSLPTSFDFALYMREASDSYILSLVDVEASTWFILAVACFINLARVKVWQTSGLTSTDDYHAPDDQATDKHRRWLGGGVEITESSGSDGELVFMLSGWILLGIAIGNYFLSRWSEIRLLRKAGCNTTHDYHTRLCVIEKLFMEAKVNLVNEQEHVEEDNRRKGSTKNHLERLKLQMNEARGESKSLQHEKGNLAEDGDMLHKQISKHLNRAKKHVKAVTHGFAPSEITKGLQGSQKLGPYFARGGSGGKVLPGEGGDEGSIREGSNPTYSWFGSFSGVSDDSLQRRNGAEEIPGGALTETDKPKIASGSGTVGVSPVLWPAVSREINVAVPAEGQEPKLPATVSEIASDPRKYEEEEETINVAKLEDFCFNSDSAVNTKKWEKKKVIEDGGNREDETQSRQELREELEEELEGSHEENQEKRDELEKEDGEEAEEEEEDEEDEEEEEEGDTKEEGDEWDEEGTVEEEEEDEIQGDGMWHERDEVGNQQNRYVLQIPSLIGVGMPLNQTSVAVLGRMEEVEDEDSYGKEVRNESFERREADLNPPSLTKRASVTIHNKARLLNVSARKLTIKLARRISNVPPNMPQFNLLNDISDIYPLGSPKLFHKTLDVLLLFSCTYLALWAVNFRPGANEKPYWLLRHVSMLVPAAGVFLFNAFSVKTSSLLLAISAMDPEIIGKVLDEQIDQEKLVAQFRERLTSRLDELGLGKSGLAAVFEEVDVTGRGELTIKELSNVLFKLNFHASKDKYRKLFNLMDTNRLGTVSYHQLFNVVYNQEAAAEEARALKMKGKMHAIK